jgi:hypothetical protein
MNRFMWQPAQSRCLNFAKVAQAIKAFSHTLDYLLSFEFGAPMTAVDDTGH